LPLYLQVIDLVLPRVNNLSFWLLFISFFLSFFSSFFVSGVYGGWTLYPPLSVVGSPSCSLDFLIFSLHAAGASSLLGSLNFIITIFFLYNRQASFFSLPLFLIGQLTVAFLLLLSLPVLTGAITMLLFDRNFNTFFFSSLDGGDAILFQHLF
jgi:cytochrome c oxidase subunit 1